MHTRVSPASPQLKLYVRGDGAGKQVYESKWTFQTSVGESNAIIRGNSAAGMWSGFGADILKELQDDNVFMVVTAEGFLDGELRGQIRSAPLQFTP